MTVGKYSRLLVSILFGFTETQPAVSDHMVFLILTSTYSKSSLLQARCHCDWGYIDTISLVLHGIAIRIH